MKPVLYYAIQRGRLYGPCIVAVTTERGGRWWGRALPLDLPTHGAFGLSGRFETHEGAQACLELVHTVQRHFSAQREKTNRVQQELRVAEEAMIDQICSGSPKRGARFLHAEAWSSETQLPGWGRPPSDLACRRGEKGCVYPHCSC